jgi:hypothetical protein
MRKTIPLILAALWLLAACTLQAPGLSASVPEEMLVATSVAGTMTALASPASPVASTPAPPESSATSAPPTPPLAASETALPTETPNATLTETPTGTPTPGVTPTLSSDDPRASLGSPTWEDNFKNDKLWRMGEDSFTKAEVEDGAFILTGRTTSDGWRLTVPTIDDVYLEMTARTGDCSGTDHYGLFFRVPDKSNPTEGYLFGLSCDGRYQLRQWDGEEMDVLIPPTMSSAIHAGPDEENRLGVMAEGDRIAVYANGVLLDEVTDDTYDEGGFGMFVGARKTSGFTIRVTNIAYWDNP